MINRKLPLIQFYNDTKETNHFDQISRTIQRNLYYYFKHSSNKPQRWNENRFNVFHFRSLETLNNKQYGILLDESQNPLKKSRIYPIRSHNSIENRSNLP